MLIGVVYSYSLSQVTTPAPCIRTPSPPALLTDSPASSSSSGPHCAHPIPHPITQTSDSPSGSTLAPLSPLVTAPVLARNSAQSNASLADGDHPACQTDSPTALADKQVPTDTTSGTSATAMTLRPRDNDNSNGNSNNNDNSVLNLAPASNPCVLGEPSRHWEEGAPHPLSISSYQTLISLLRQGVFHSGKGTHKPTFPPLPIAVVISCHMLQAPK